ncbi:MAG TPA: hypothetical protein VLA06_06145 [Woeseiaceae bacterium]|jgi:hypothetical protein|nr:hypothetical protein [Woeseiaceae bacterium]
MKTVYPLMLVALCVPSLALAQDAGEYRCTYGDMLRRVEILTEPGVTVPCEVHYYKDTEAPGEKQVLWSAQSQAGYCEEKVDGLLARLEGYGWDCGRVEGAEAESLPAETADEDAIEDDTDVLSPGTPEG